MIGYPYMVSNNKIAPIIEKIQQAARPAKFTQEVLKNLGFTSFGNVQKYCNAYGCFATD